MSKTTFNTAKDLLGKEGLKIGPSDWMEITQERINTFADATDDQQWIHVDEEKAAKYSPTKTTIAHGFMSVAMLSELISDLIEIKSVKLGLNYGLNKVRFPNSVPVNSELRLVSSLKQIDDFPNGKKLTFNCLMEIKGHEKPACVAEFIFVLIE